MEERLARGQRAENRSRLLVKDLRSEKLRYKPPADGNQMVLVVALRRLGRERRQPPPPAQLHGLPTAFRSALKAPIPVGKQIPQQSEWALRSLRSPQRCCRTTWPRQRALQSLSQTPHFSPPRCLRLRPFRFRSCPLRHPPAPTLRFQVRRQGHWPSPRQSLA